MAIHWFWRQRRILATSAALAAALTLGACGVKAPPDARFAVEDFGSAAPRAPCADHQPLRSALFGDLHVHTGLSSDAWKFGVRATPDDAYRYAFGGAVELPGADGAVRTIESTQPLDFMAVTDHAEFLGEQTLCLDPKSSAYATRFCRGYRIENGRDFGLAKRIIAPWSWRDRSVCGSRGERCAEAARIPWRRIIDAAEAWNDTSDRCQRSTFIGFEYSSHRLGSNLHRNVIFKNAKVTRLPISYLDATREWELWRLLEEQCHGSKSGCEAIAIPHNSNISNGRMFAPEQFGNDRRGLQRAALRARMEPVVEIMQHKGDSECRNGLAGVLGGPDELCDFEKFENLTFLDKYGEASAPACGEGFLADWRPRLGPSCLSPLSYTRYALIAGLGLESQIGINPFKFGLIGATDTHNAIGGAVDEANYPGHLGRADASADRRLRYKDGLDGNASNNPGGLVGVWAEENTRESIFAALRRREVFGTSGPRIRPRLFGGWDYPLRLCEDPQHVAVGYQRGTPMGGDLSAPPTADSAPMFLVSALADPGTAWTPGATLQRVQIIKGWRDDAGNYHQRVHEVAGSPGASDAMDEAVDDQCRALAVGHAQLCTVWRDPDFDPSRRAVYYARAVEVPGCRYSARQCLQLPPEKRPDDCRRQPYPRVIAERAWTSPIWYSPSKPTAEH